VNEPSALADPRAVVDPGAVLGEGTTVGPYAVVGPDVVIGARVRIHSHVVIQGPAEIGDECDIHPFASLGGPPQDLKYRGERTRLVVGRRNVIREACTLNRGTSGGGGVTTIGDDNLFMTLAHVAHDCHIGSGTIFGNAATLAGHVTVGDFVTISAYSGVHQHCRLGDHAYIGGYSVITQDALPFVLTVGNRAESHGINVIGLKRRGFSDEAITAPRRAYQRIFRSKKRLEVSLPAVEKELGGIPEVRQFLEVVRSSERGVMR
jgi:UDP-N-acetylglucosamine acyltransferase